MKKNKIIRRFVMIAWVTLLIGCGITEKEMSQSAGLNTDGEQRIEQDMELNEKMDEHLEGEELNEVIDTKQLSAEQIQAIISPYTDHIVAYVVDSFDAELDPMSDYGIAEFVCWTYVATEQFDYGNIPLADFNHICKNSFGRTIDIEKVADEYERRYPGDAFIVDDEISMSVGDWGGAWPHTLFESINYKGEGLYEVELVLGMEYFDFDDNNESRIEEKGRATVSILYDDELDKEGYIYSIVFH